MAATHGIRWFDTKAADRHGTAAIGQASDGTGAENDLAKYDADGSLTDAGIAADDVLTVSGTGGGAGLAADSWYGQIPRGTKNGSNATFHLDYELANPHTICCVNGVLENPLVDGDSLTDPQGGYTISGTTLTLSYAPKTDDRTFHIWYFRNKSAPFVSEHGAITNVVLTATTSGDFTVAGVQQGEHLFELAQASAAGGGGPSYSLNDAFGMANGGGVWDAVTDNVTLTLHGASNPTNYYVTDGFQVGFRWQVINAFLSQGTGTINIYDLYLTVSYADGTSHVFYPESADLAGTILLNTSENPDEQNGTFDVQNPLNAIDGDPDTFATVLCIQGSESRTNTPAQVTYTWGDITTY
jgi:hypothetical protein